MASCLGISSSSEGQKIFQIAVTRAVVSLALSLLLTYLLFYALHQVILSPIVLWAFLPISPLLLLIWSVPHVLILRYYRRYWRNGVAVIIPAAMASGLFVLGIHLFISGFDIS